LGMVQTYRARIAEASRTAACSWPVTGRYAEIRTLATALASSSRAIGTSGENFRSPPDLGVVSDGA
jgi:hypothetical protein